MRRALARSAGTRAPASAHRPLEMQRTRVFLRAVRTSGGLCRIVDRLFRCDYSGARPVHRPPRAPNPAHAAWTGRTRFLRPHTPRDSAATPVLEAHALLARAM